ncbi:MAG TPA: hypothetical protein VFE19_11335 [Jatrophihabitantaceae bacterium]|nr:hypothetical protein [Jatrophihabitantaceae bacterium]
MFARRLVAVLCSVTILLGVALALPSPSSAATPLHWGKGQAVDPMQGGYFSISCSSRSFCLAGGANGDVREWDGQRWRQQTVLANDNSPIADMQCISSTFCAAAVDSREGGYRPATFDGTRWTEADFVEGVGAGDISCVSSQMCMLISNEGQYQRWNGSRWTPARKLDRSIQVGHGTVSCATARRCIAVIGEGEVFGYNGSSWRASLSDPIGRLAALQCPSTSWCLGINSSGRWTRLVHSRWTKRSSFGTRTVELSCPSTGFCISTDSAGGVYAYRHGRWHARHKIDATFPLVDVSCLSRSFCAAVTYSGDSVIRAAGRWQRPQPTDPAFGSLADVSCPTRAFCAAVDFSGGQLHFNRSRWSAPKRVPREPDALQSVSCPSVSFCMAVSDIGYTTRTQHTWAAPTRLHSGIFEVSCASRRFCVASTFDDELLRYDGQGWRKITNTDVGALSCAARSNFCMAISDQGDYVVIHRDSVSAAQDTGDSAGFFDAVSCSSNSFCGAIDGNGRTLEWSRGAWTAPVTNSGGSFSALSCTSRTFCAAVGGGRAATFNGSRWTNARKVIPGRVFLRAISCVGQSFCVAVDENSGSAFLAR